MNGADPNRILNECRAVDQAIDELEADLQRLKGLQSRYLADTNTSAQSPLRLEVDRTGDNIMTKYRGLVSRVKNIKQQPESGNPRNAPQVGKVDRRLKTAINQYQQVEREFRKASQDQMARQYRIVRPDASDAEVREAVEDPNNQQVFSSALIQSDRRGEAQTVARNVSQRHEDIQKIERQMIELAQLFQDLEALVVQQEPAVTQIEQRGEEVTQHVAQANTELGGAVVKARAARRKKWWCLGIVGESHAQHTFFVSLTLSSSHHPRHRGGCGGGCRSHEKIEIARPKQSSTGAAHAACRLHTTLRSSCDSRLYFKPRKSDMI